MLYLILAIASSALVSIFIRLSENYVKNNISMLCMNYMMCLLLAVGYTGMDKVFETGEGFGTAIGLGVVNGILFLASFVLLQINVRRNGVVLSATFMKLGVLVPTLLSVIAFREKPEVQQVIGFLVALLAIVLINFEKGQGEAGFKIGLILLLLGGGSGDAMAKIYDEVGAAQFEEQFLCFTFASALVLCVILVIKKQQKLTKTDILFGLLVGIPNYFSARFLLKAVGEVPAVVAYPTYSVATIVVISVVGMLCFKEKITKRQQVAIGIILVALVLLNI